MTDKALIDMSLTELQQELMTLTREQFNLRMQNATSENTKPHLFKKTRRAIARIKMTMAQKSKVGVSK